MVAISRRSAATSLSESGDAGAGAVAAWTAFRASAMAFNSSSACCRAAAASASMRAACSARCLSASGAVPGRGVSAAVVAAAVRARTRLSRSSIRAARSRRAVSTAALAVAVASARTACRSIAGVGADTTTSWPRHIARMSGGQNGSEISAPASTTTWGGGGAEVGAGEGISLIVSAPFTPASASRSISSSTAWRVGRSAATVALKGNADRGPKAAGLMARAVTSRRAPAKPASPTSLAKVAAARGEKNIAASSARAARAARADSGSVLSSRAS